MLGRTVWLLCCLLILAGCAGCVPAEYTTLGGYWQQKVSTVTVQEDQADAALTIWKTAQEAGTTDTIGWMQLLWQEFHNQGIDSALIYIDGNLLAIGQKYNYPWNIAVLDPADGVTPIITIPVEDSAIVTLPGIESIQSITVIGRDPGTCWELARKCADGSSQEILQAIGYHAIWLTQQHTILTAGNLTSITSLQQDWEIRALSPNYPINILRKLQAT